MDTTCCVVGGGPAGMMLAFLLARSGVKVTVLEKHNDFFRDFRGDTIHPSTLEILNELGLYDEFLQLPHSEIRGLSATIGGKTFRIYDFSRLPTRAKFIALMPQWDFLDFLARQGAKYPGFDLRMGWEATSLIEQEGRVTGVHVRTPEGALEISAGLVVGCDGRHAISRAAGHLPVMETGVPIDVLWLRIPRLADDPENALGYIDFGRALLLINRNDYFQCGYLIAKGAFPELQERGLPEFQQSIERLAPFLKGRNLEIDSWNKVKLLTVQINYLKNWSRPGLLCIGDAAHAMSPVGGIGINIALQDAVAAANLLAEPLRTGSLRDDDLRAVQLRRERAARLTQRFQAMAHRVMNWVLTRDGPLQPPLLLRLATHVPGFQRLAGRLMGMGIQPEHVRDAATRS